MKLTIATAVRNAIAEGRRAELVRCIESVATLETSHEHLVYDGASTDGTVDLLRELESKTPGLKVVSEPDAGIYNALNKGVRDARGEWFYVLGSDDWVFAPTVMDSLLRNAGSARFLVAPVRAEGSVLQIPDKTNLSTIFYRTPHCHQGILVQTDDIRSIGGFDESLSICADLDVMLKLHGKAIPAQYSFEPFADYSLSGVSEKRVEIRRKETVQCIRRFLGLPDGPGFGGKQSPQFRTMARFVFHEDKVLRLSARAMVRKRAKRIVRILLYPLVFLTRPVRKWWNHQAEERR